MTRLYSIRRCGLMYSQARLPQQVTLKAAVGGSSGVPSIHEQLSAQMALPYACKAPTQIDRYNFARRCIDPKRRWWCWL